MEIENTNRTSHDRPTKLWTNIQHKSGITDYANKSDTKYNKEELYNGIFTGLTAF